MEPKPKRTMTDKQKTARLANLERGRAKRKEMIQKKKEPKPDEYDISSDDESYDASSSSSESDDGAFIISKKKKVTKSPKTKKAPSVPVPKVKSVRPPN